MKILMLNYEFPPLGGGAANANRHILEEFTKEDVEIDLITSSPHDYSEEQFSDDITIYKVDVDKDEIHHWKQIEIIRYIWKGFKKSRELKDENDYDAIHAWFGFPCGLMAKILGLPYIVSLRGSDVPGYNERFSLQYIFLTPIIKSVWRSAERVIPNSQGLMELAQETLNIGMQVVPNGVDTETFQPRYDSNGDLLQLLCVARLTPRKRIKDIIKALEGVKKTKLVIIGEGPQENKLKKLAYKLDIEDKVEFLGYIPHQNLPERYQQADIFVMPSLNEGMSNTILEAISSGLPVITTQTGGTEELIGENGIVVPKKSPSSVKSAIQEYRNNPVKLREQAENSREIAEEMSWKNVADKYLEIYGEVADDG